MADSSVTNEAMAGTGCFVFVNRVLPPVWPVYNQTLPIRIIHFWWRAPAEFCEKWVQDLLWLDLGCHILEGAPNRWCQTQDGDHEWPLRKVWDDPAQLNPAKRAGLGLGHDTPSCQPHSKSIFRRHNHRPTLRLSEVPLSQRSGFKKREMREWGNEETGKIGLTSWRHQVLCENAW